MIKRIGSIFLTLAIFITMLPLEALAARSNEQSIVINASNEEDNTITVGEQDTGGEAQGDVLSLSAAVENAIESDYDQTIEVQVKNLSSQPVQYYLECKNDYTDIYMNFVKSGSVDAPLTIQANETQTVELSVFAQNARRTSYRVLVLGKVAGGETVEMPLSFSCEAADGEVGFRKGTVDRNTLATDYTVTNTGSSTISDLTLAISGEAADYIRISPSVENYALEANQHVKVKLIPDLSKMKKNQKTSISGTLQAEGGGVGSTTISFDTGGKEITATTIGELALMQDENPYHGIEADLDSMNGKIGDKKIDDLATKYLEDNTGVNTSKEVNEVYSHLFDETGMFRMSLESDFVYETEEGAQMKVPVALDIHAEAAAQSETKRSAKGAYSYDESTSTLTYTSIIYMTRTEYDAMIASFKNSVEQEFQLPSGNDSIASISAMGDSDPNEEIAVEFSLKILEEAAEDSLIGKGFKFMNAIDTSVDGLKTLSVIANPKYTDAEKLTYTALNGAKVFMQCWGGKALTGALSASLDGPGVIVGLLGNALIDYGLDKLTEAYEQNVLGFGGAIYYDIYGHQCTNAKRVTSSFYLPDTDTSDVGLYETGRMYDGNPYGGNAGYADEQFGGDAYIHDRPVDYFYTLNSYNVGETQNNGLTSVSIVDLSRGAEYLKPGKNTIIRYYNTNAGHYSVAADTEITVLYPSDTPISYIGSPDTMEEVRLRPDFAVYWENILPAHTAIINEQNTVSVNLYNRGSMGGWADVTVSADDRIVYEQENLYLAAFSEEKISFEWTPSTENTKLKVTLENKCVGVEERKNDNNTAARTITARSRQVPQFGTIAPSVAVQNDVLYVTADLTDTADLDSVSFIVNETNYSGDDVTLVETANGARATVKLQDLEPGTYTVKAMATYYNKVGTKETVNSNDHIVTVKTPGDTNFTVSKDVSNPRFIVLQKNGSHLYPVHAEVTENADSNIYTLVETTDIANNEEDYYLLTICTGGVILAPIANLSPETSLTLAGGKTVSIQQNSDETELSSVYLSGLDNNGITSPPDVILPEENTLIVKGADSVKLQINFTVNGLGSSANVEQSLNEEPSTVDLSAFYKLYRFNCPDVTGHISYIDIQVYAKTEQRVSTLYGATKYNENNKQVSLLIDGAYDLERLEEAESVMAYLPIENALYAADLTNYNEDVTLSRTGFGQITYICSAGTPTIEETLLRVGDYYNTLYMYGMPLSMPAGTYAIAVNYELNGKQLFHTEQVTVSSEQTATVTLPGNQEGTTATLTINWPEWLADQGSVSYLVETDESDWYRNIDVERNVPVEISAGTVDLDTYLYKSSADGSNIEYDLSVTREMTLGENQNVDMEIGGAFQGVVGANSHINVYPGTNIQLNFDALKDSSGNELNYYWTSKAEWALRGTVTLVNTDDPTQKYEIEASTTSFSGSLNFELPNVVAPGTYSYTVTLSNSEIPEQPETEHSIVASADPGGSIDPSGSVSVIEGESQSFTIRPNSGYAIQEVLVDGVSQGAISSYSFYNVTEDHTITARFREKETTSNNGNSGNSGTSSGGDYSASVNTAIGGKVTVTPSRADRGDTVAITVQPDDGYELDKLIVTDTNGNEIDVKRVSDTRYTFIMPRSKVTVEPVFKPIENTPSIPFADVSENAYYHDAVLWAVENGVTNGTNATSFSPDATVTRAQMVTFLWRAHGSPDATGSNPFADVSTDAYYYDAVQWAVENGVTNGTSATSFSPDATVSRAQAVTFQWRAAGSPEVSGDSFNDVAEDAYYANAVTWAVSNSVTNGTGGNNFSPEADVSRAQAVTFLWRELA